MIPEMSDSNPVTVDLSMSMSDLGSSVVVVSEQDISSAGASPAKLTPASKRKRDDLVDERSKFQGVSDTLESIPVSILTWLVSHIPRCLK